MAWINLEKIGATDSPYVVRLMPRQKIERQIAQRRYAWKKPTQQIADEAGVSRDVVKRVLERLPVSDASYATLTSYLVTPAGKWSLINNRQKKSPADGDRNALLQRVLRLSGMAIDYGLRTFARVTLASFTQGELKAYYYRLEFSVKERVLRNERWPDSIKGKYVIPDSLEAWEWVERLDQLLARQTISAKLPNVRTSHLAASQPGKPNPYIVPARPFRSL